MLASPKRMKLTGRPMKMVFDRENIDKKVPRLPLRTLKTTVIAVAARNPAPIAMKGTGSPGSMESSLLRSYPPIRFDIM